MDAEGLQTRLDDFTIVQSMFPMGEELKIFHSYENIEQVKSAFNERPHDPTLEAVVYFSLDDDTDPKSAAPGHATMKLVVPLVIGSKPTATLIDVQPLISRKDYDLLARLVVNQSAATTAAVPLTELLLEAMDLVRTSYQLFQGSNSQRLAEESARKFAEQTQTALGEGDDWRVWFFFPSLSTKEKRNDLVMYARERKMTGFVLAGKPGLLCVEGPIDVIDEYMAAIKSQSWSDIPSYQKKVRIFLSGRGRTSLASIALIYEANQLLGGCLVY